MDNLSDIQREYKEILNQLSNPELISDWPASNASRSDAGWKKFEELSKRKSYLEKIIEKEKEIKEIDDRIEENRAILNGKEGPELSSLAEIEITQFRERKEVLEKELKKLIKGQKESSEPQDIIVEIRAGAGGDEAALFVGDLFKMYSRFAEQQGWRQKILNSSPTETGGFKEIVFQLESIRNASHSDADGNGDIFSKMKNESGVHRVQRIPETEKSGRIHTSTVSVAILPKPKNTQLEIKPDELKIEYCRSSGPGGQNVNKRETAVRIVHIPTGLVVESQTERNQLQNKENALSVLSARLLEIREEEEAQKLGGDRKGQIGRAKRAEKNRTYNFPQDRVTDHRIKKSFHGIKEIMEGRLDPIIEAMESAEEQEE